MEAARITQGMTALHRRGLVPMLVSALLVASGLAHGASPARAPDISPAVDCESNLAPQVARQATAGYLDVRVCRGSGTAWIVVVRRGGSKRAVMESAHFLIGQGRFGYGFGVDAIVVDAPDRFHIQFTYGSASAPNSDIFRFAWRDSAWRVVGRDFSTMARCADGSIDTSSHYSANYLTHRAVATLYKGCQVNKTVRASLHVIPLTLQGFDPLDPTLRPKEFAAYF